LKTPEARHFLLLSSDDEPTGTLLRARSPRAAALKAMSKLIRSAVTLPTQANDERVAGGPEDRHVVRHSHELALFDERQACIHRFSGWQEVRPGLMADHPSWFPIEEARGIRKTCVRETGCDALDDRDLQRLSRALEKAL
jgi:hypothetical protein